jgi:hypothetical protein
MKSRHHQYAKMTALQTIDREFTAMIEKKGPKAGRHGRGDHRAFAASPCPVWAKPSWRCRESA